MKRTLSETTCVICKETHKTIGFQSHLKHKHNITPTDYIEKYGEYRPKYLEYNKRSTTREGKMCLVCGESFASERHRSFHIIKDHGMSKRDYIIQHELNGVIPKCKCGCGEDVKILEKGKLHYREYLTGHNTHMHIGTFRSKESKLRMRKSAIERMKRGDAVFYTKSSKCEIELRKFIESIYNGKLIFNDTDILNGLELDIVLPELKLAFEMNGDMFHSDLHKKNRYHINKTKECKGLGYRLIHIWYSDWYSKNEIIKSIIKSILHVGTDRIYARKCQVKKISNEISSRFLSKNHLQGSCISSKRYGLYYNEELVQVMTFSKLRKSVGRESKEGCYELLRSASKLNTSIIGGTGRLFKHFIKTENPEYILSFANRDWSVGNVYDKLNMKFVRYTEPGYFYSKSRQRYHRYQFQKHKLVKMGYDKNKTEYEIMTDLGYCRIWNTGNLVYEWDKK